MIVLAVIHRGAVMQKFPGGVAMEVAGATVLMTSSLTLN